MKNYLFLLSICTLFFLFVGCKETGASTDKKSAPKENPRGKKFLVKAKQYSQEAFLAHKSADKAAKGNASGGSSSDNNNNNNMFGGDKPE